MKPGTFAVFLLLLVLGGAAAGGVAGYSLHESNPFAETKGRPASVGTELIRGLVGTETLDAGYEESRRRWAAGGLAGGAVLGLLCAATVGSYSLRYRAQGRPSATT